MEWDDIIYLSILFSCIGFGHILRKIKDKELQKWVATLFGFLIVFIASGRHILHPIITVLVNAFIIKYVKKRLVDFKYTYIYISNIKLDKTCSLIPS